MPERKRIQGPEETRSPLLYLKEEEKSAGKPLVRTNSSHLSPCSPVGLAILVIPHGVGDYRGQQTRWEKTQ